MADFKVVAERGRYVLGEEDDIYGIWDLDSGSDEPIERFPMSDDGFEQAWSRLRFRDRVERDPVAKALATVIIVGVLMWILGGGATAVAYLVPLEAYGVLSLAVSILDATGLRLAVGGVLVLATLFLVRRRDREPAVPSSPISIARGDRLDQTLQVSLVVALVVWLVAAIVTASLIPTSPLGPFDPPSDAERAAVVAEVIAFDVWTAAAVLIALRLLIRIRGGPPNS